MSRRVVVAATIAVLAGGTVPASACDGDSGIRGLVTEGPTCPVAHEGETCSGPYAGAEIRVRRARDGQILRRVRTGKHGRFRVRLHPGRYVLDPVNGHPFPHADEKRVRVEDGRFTYVEIDYDTGLR